MMSCGIEAAAVSPAPIFTKGPLKVLVEAAPVTVISTPSIRKKLPPAVAPWLKSRTGTPAVELTSFGIFAASAGVTLLPRAGNVGSSVVMVMGVALVHSGLRRGNVRGVDPT